MLEPVVVFDAIKIRYYDNLMEDGLDEEELRMRAQIQVRAVNFILVVSVRRTCPWTASVTICIMHICGVGFDSCDYSLLFYIIWLPATL